MIPLKYTDQNGREQVTDIDSLIDVVRGPSGKRHGWRALVTYAPSEEKFLELRDAPPDLRGDSRSETEEVTASYVQSTFGLTSAQVSEVQNRPNNWELVEL